jgi:hypothetical protein
VPGAPGDGIGEPPGVGDGSDDPPGVGDGNGEPACEGFGIGVGNGELPCEPDDPELPDGEGEGDGIGEGIGDGIELPDEPPLGIGGGFEHATAPTTNAMPKTNCAALLSMTHLMRFSLFSDRLGSRYSYMPQR